LPSVVEQHDKKDIFFTIPDLLIGPGDEVLTPIYSPVSNKDTPQVDSIPEPNEEDDRDIWILPVETPPTSAYFHSWDGFERQKDEENNTPYITEAGPSMFDTAIAATENYLHIENGDHLVVNSKVYVAGLLALGLGRSSIFFEWDEESHIFKPALSMIRISGYSGSCLVELTATFLECGNITRYLQAFIDKVYSKTTSPARTALADVVSTLLATIQSRLSASTAVHVSMLQLEALFRPAHSILTCFQQIILNVSATRSDESMLSTIFEEIQLLEHRTDSLRDILLQVLSRVSQPWLEFAGEWLGIQLEAGVPLTKNGQGRSFVRVEKKEWIDEQGFEVQEPDFMLDYDKIPSFIAPGDARAMFEIGRSIRFLRDHHADHPLARSEIIASANPPSLEWKFSWNDIVQVEARALQYEQDLTNAILRFQDPAPATEPAEKGKSSNRLDFKFDFFGRSEEDMQAHVLASIAVFNTIPLPTTQQSCLSAALNKYFNSRTEAVERSESVFAPPISLSPILSFNPIIAAQARVVNGTCMRMFFNSHNLREHLNLQRSFHLLGNGVFSSRLSHALFDPELESAERHRGVARSGGIMGLRLGGRDTWPPASSELRLALMGVLTESYVSDRPLNKSYSGCPQIQDPLPGDLSFAVRDMTEDEIEKCMNPDSVEALDFLRLSYKPPPPLDAVITPIILFKYDQLFKLLLRVIRMLYVVNALFRDAIDQTSHWQGFDNTAQRFRIEAHHFISSVSGYFFDTGIRATWRVFERKLDQIEDRINKDSDNITLGQNEGLDKLRDYHERVLDRIMFALFLRKRQQPVLKLLEEIFTLILQFSKHSRENVLGLPSNIGEDEFRAIYMRFRKKVGVFITVCRGLSEKKGYGDNKDRETKMSDHENLFDGDDLAEENTVAQLLMTLEMSNYYSKLM
jgi:hypothetical protein